MKVAKRYAISRIFDSGEVMGRNSIGAKQFIRFLLKCEPQWKHFQVKIEKKRIVFYLVEIEKK